MGYNGATPREKKLPNRLALVINGATGEKYLIKTQDFKLSEKTKIFKSHSS